MREFGYRAKLSILSSTMHIGALYLRVRTVIIFFLLAFVLKQLKKSSRETDAISYHPVYFSFQIFLISTLLAYLFTILNSEPALIS